MYPPNIAGVDLARGREKGGKRAIKGGEGQHGRGFRKLERKSLNRN